MDDLQRQFIEDCKAYAEMRGWKLSTLGAKAVGDSKLFTRMHEGGSCTFTQAARVRTFIESNLPELADATPRRTDHGDRTVSP